MPVRYFDNDTNEYVNINATYTKKTSNGKSYYEVKLPKAVTTNKIQVSPRTHGAYLSYTSISEIRFYNYDSIEDETRDLFTDDLQIQIKDDVTQEMITKLVNRANTKDEVSGEFHPNQKLILEELQLAQDLYNDRKKLTEIMTLNEEINNSGKHQDKAGNYTLKSNDLGMGNDWQALGLAARAGDEITVYVGSTGSRTPQLIYTQYYGESGAYKSKEITLKKGKNVIQIEKLHDLDVERGGSLYVRYPYDTPDTNNDVQVRVSGAVKIPHLNVTGKINDTTKENEVKVQIKEYIQQLKSFNDTVSDKYYPGKNENNIYNYFKNTSVLNTTDIESDKVTLNFPATAVYEGIVNGGLNQNIDAQVNRLYDSLLAWEQIMDIAYAQRGVYKTQDLDKNGIISEEEDVATKNHMAPKSRMNIKYQRMFIGAFMYASGNHVGVEYGSVPGLVQGQPFKLDNSGKVTESGDLFGWGIGHEVGHVTDIGRMTYSETSNNVLALLTQTFDDTTESRLEGSTMKKIYDHVTSNSLGVPSDVFVRLGMLWQLHLGYEENRTSQMLVNNVDADLTNDSFYAKLTRKYRELSNDLPENSLGRDQLLVVMASDVVKKDLRDYFKAWGIEITSELNSIMNARGYEKETRKIQYLSDEARRKVLNDNISAMSNDTKVVANLGGKTEDGKTLTINDGDTIKSKQIPITLGVSKDADKVLGYEIVRSDGNYQDAETGKTMVKYKTVGFVDANNDGTATFVDDLGPVNNRAFEYKVVAYDYHLNKTEEINLGSIKVSHKGELDKTKWSFTTNTTSTEDKHDENNSHGPLQNSSINKVSDGNSDTVYKGKKMTKAEWDKDPHKNPEVNVNEKSYVIVDMNEKLPIVGLKYTKPESATKTSKFSLKNLFSRNAESEYAPLTGYTIQVSNDKTNWQTVSTGNFEFGKTVLGQKDEDNVARVTFNEDGKLWTYQARYVKLISNNSQNIEIAELDIIGPPGDNIEIGTVDAATQNKTNGIGKLDKDFAYGKEANEIIPAGSIVVTGEYSGDPAFNVALLVDENNATISGETLLFAEVPENGNLGEVSQGTWVYWIGKEDFSSLTSKVKAELYRYNDLEKIGEDLIPIGQRFVSDTLYTNIDAKGYDELPIIKLESEATKLARLKNTANVVKINEELKQQLKENR